jgi:hypothetical protein
MFTKAHAHGNEDQHKGYGSKNGANHTKGPRSFHGSIQVIVGEKVSILPASTVRAPVNFSRIGNEIRLNSPQSHPQRGDLTLSSRKGNVEKVTVNGRDPHKDQGNEAEQARNS